MYSISRVGMSKEGGGHSFSPILIASVKAGSEGLTESDEMGVDKGCVHSLSY